MITTFRFDQASVRDLVDAVACPSWSPFVPSQQERGNRRMKLLRDINFLDRLASMRLYCTYYQIRLEADPSVPSEDHRSQLIDAFIESGSPVTSALCSTFFNP